MKRSMQLLVMLVVATASGQVVAQGNDDELAAEMRKAEARLLQQELEMNAAKQSAEAQHEAALMQSVAERRRMEVQAERSRQQAAKVGSERERANVARSVEVELRMREAEQALAAAAQEMAQLSRRQLPRVAQFQKFIDANHGPLLGINIVGNDSAQPVDGVTVSGVTPGGAAAEAGLQAGDVLTSINDEPLNAETGQAAAARLLDFMQGVKEGDELSVEYRRDGQVASVEITPRVMQPRTFAFEFDADELVVPDAPHHGGWQQFRWVAGSNGFGDMELVKLTENLGSYFGTDEGLLVVRAPDNESLQLRDGDVIQMIDGREPTSASHAMRILGSYESGETMEVSIMRNKRRETVSIVVPEDTRSFSAPAAVPTPSPVLAPSPAPAPAPAPARAVRQVVVTPEQTR